MTPRAKLHLGILLLAVATSGTTALFLRERRDSARTRGQARTLLGTPSNQSQNPLRPTGDRKTAAVAALDGEKIRAFREIFGQDLQFQMDAFGRLVSVKGAPGAGTRVDGFSSQNASQVLARSRQVLEAASELLGVNASHPLEKPNVQTGMVSSQVRFQEMFEGLALAPLGTVSVDLGPLGELLALDSSYLPDVEPMNSSRLDPESARKAALGSMETEGPSVRGEGGTALIWVASPYGENGRSVAYRAMEVFIEGRQVIVNAEDGSILLKRDRRHF